MTKWSSELIQNRVEPLSVNATVYDICLDLTRLKESENLMRSFFYYDHAFVNKEKREIGILC